jgi:hypothetical protein
LSSEAERSRVPKVSEVYPSVFHYTTEAGLYGIIESQRLWATHFSYLNDANELHNARQLLSEVFRRRLESILERMVREGKGAIADGHTPKSLAELDKGTFVDALYRVSLKIATPFIASFCAHRVGSPEYRDGLLSQWRGYGKGGGFALEFDSQGIETGISKDVAANTALGCFFGDVVYMSGAESHPEIAEDAEIVSRIADDFMPVLLRQDRANPDVTYSYEPFVRCMSRLKHDGFREESEVRIVYMRPSQVSEELSPPIGIHFRGHPKARVPYIELFSALDSLPIKRIIVGPHPQASLRRSSIELLLKERRLGIDVSTSEIPYLPD